MIEKRQNNNRILLFQGLFSGPFKSAAAIRRNWTYCCLGRARRC